MKVEEVSINSVFLTNRTLKIPYFQRAYVWEEPNWEKFYNDVAEIALVLKENEEQGLDGEPEIYFMGSIILKKGKSANLLEVIDGQQRLSTIVLFMKALYLSIERNDRFNSEFMKNDIASGGNSEPILVPNHNDRLIYEEIVS